MSLDNSLLSAMYLHSSEGRLQMPASEVYLYVVLPLDDNRLLSFEDFSFAVSAEIKKMNDFVLIKGVQRILKLRQLKEMAAYLEKISESFDLLNRKVDETKLLAINTLINSSLCGLSGESFSGVVKQVNLLCNQSKNFLIDIKTGIESTHVALDSILNLVKSTIEAEMNVMTSLKAKVDFHLGKLSTHQQYQAKHQQSDYYPFQELIEADFQLLLKAIFTTHDHVSILMSKRHQDLSLEDNIEQSLQQLKVFSDASLLLK